MDSQKITILDKVFNKLVRDKIPEKIEANGDVAKTRVLSDEEFRIELYKKLQEEVKEVIDAKNSGDRIEELADVYEVISSIAELENKNINEVISVADTKRKIRGGFERKILLVETYKKVDYDEFIKDKQ